MNRQKLNNIDGFIVCVDRKDGIKVDQETSIGIITPDQIQMAWPAYGKPDSQEKQDEYRRSALHILRKAYESEYGRY